MEILPNECIYEIFQYAYPKDLLLCAQVNNNLNSLGKMESLWQNISKNDCNIFFVRGCWLFHRTWHLGSLWKNINNDGSSKENVWYEACKLYYQICILNFTFGMKRGDIRLFSHRLDVNSHKLQVLPPEISVLTNLFHLSLGNNKLKQLPPEIGKLQNLKWLYMGQNEIETLPPEIGLLTKLESLGLSNNRLKTLPKEIGQLINLLYLGLSNNLLTEIPLEVNKLTKLRELYFGGNPELEELPVEIRQLPMLVAYGVHGPISRDSTNFMPIIYGIIIGIFLFLY